MGDLLWQPPTCTFGGCLPDHRGREGYIGVGFQTDEVTLARLPGWEVHSYGYHGDDGYVFSGSGRGQSYGPGCATGDVIGALLNRAERTIR